MDFCGDPDLILPVDAQWGAIGKLFDQVFFIFKFLHVFCVFNVSKTKLKSFSCMQMWVLFDL